MIIKRTNKEIDELLNLVNSRINDGGTEFGGMTYEQGVEAGIEWILGRTNEHPYEVTADDGA